MTINTAAAKLFGLVLVGGKSTRMQRRKADIVYHETPEWRRCFELLTAKCDTVFISATTHNTPEDLADQPVIMDLFINPCGPLGAIISAFKTHPHNAWLVLACDMPLFDKNSVAKLVNFRNPSSQATAFLSPRDGCPEPLSTIYEPSAFSTLLNAWGQGFLCPRTILGSMHVERLIPDENTWLDNANTPEEFQKIHHQLARVEQ